MVAVSLRTWRPCHGGGRAALATKLERGDKRDSRVTDDEAAASLMMELHVVQPPSIGRSHCRCQAPEYLARGSVDVEPPSFVGQSFS